MKVTLTNGVEWDTTAKEQNEQAREWIRENVMERLGCTPDEEGKIAPSMDACKRPVSWTADFDTFTVTVEREYVDPKGFSWAMKNEHITVTSKTK